MITKKIILSFALLTIGFNLSAASYTKSEVAPRKTCTSIVKKALCFLLLGSSVFNQNMVAEAYCPTKTKELPGCETISIPKSLCRLEDMSLTDENIALDKNVKSMCAEISPYSLRVLLELEDEYQSEKRYNYKQHGRCHRFMSLYDKGGSLSIIRANRICNDPKVAKAIESMKKAESTWELEWKPRS